MLFFAERFIIFSLVQNTKNAGLFQLVEHRTRNAGVVVSIPIAGITLILKVHQGLTPEMYFFSG